MTTATPTGLCKDCLATGLPILPVRYAVVPSNVVASTATGGDKHTSVDLWPDYKYVLRMIRHGFIYVYYETHPKKSKYWECYGITQDGLLVKQPERMITNAVQQGETVHCNIKGHSNTRLEFLVIEDAQNCGYTWIAYSSNRWTDAIRKQVEVDPSILMQMIHPSDLIASDNPIGLHVQAANLANLKRVLDYDPKFDTTQLPHDTKPANISLEDGTHDSAKLAQRSTIHRWHKRYQTVDKTLAAMQKQGVRPNAPPHNGIILALGDAVGVAEELNGYMADINARNTQYIMERGLQVTAIDSIDKTYKALKKGIAIKWRLKPDGYELTTLRAAIMQCAVPQPYDSSTGAFFPLLEALIDLDNEYKSDGISEAQYKKERTEFIQLNATNPAEMEKRYAIIDQHRKVLWAQQKIAVETEFNRQILDLRDRLNEPALTTFASNWKTFRDACDKLIDPRAKALVKWLEGEPLLNALECFDPNSPYEGTKFQDCIAQIIFGLHTTPSGNQKIAEWVAAGVADRANLVWRTVAYNQTEAAKVVNDALAYAKEHHFKEHTLTSLAESAKNIKNWQRLVDTFKKGFTMDVTNSRAVTEGTKAFGSALISYNLRGTDKFFATVVNKVFDCFIVRKPGDFVGELIIKRIFLLRGSGGDDNATMRLLTCMAKENKPSPRELLNFINRSRAMLEALPEDKRYSVKAQLLSQAWDDFKGRGKFDALKDSRLTLAVMLVEMFYLRKLIIDTEGDWVTQSKIVASATSLSAGAFDIWTLAHKAIWGNDDMTYQKLKLYGGALSGIASFIGGVVDVIKGIQKRNHPRGIVPSLHVAKGIVGMTAGAMNGLTAFSYSARFIETAGGKKAVRMITREGITEAAAVRGQWIVVRRVAFMSAGLWLTVGMLVLEATVIFIDDNDMEKWFDKCAFGKKRAKDGYKDMLEQTNAIRAAMRFEL